MSSAANPTYTANGTALDQGTLLDLFDLNMAMIPGMSEDTVLAQLAKALAYWQNVVATATPGSYQATLANLAVTWIQARQAYVANPPPNTLHIVYPV